MNNTRSYRPISFIPTILAAFFFGALIGLGWQYFPLTQKWISLPESTNSGLGFSGDRIGRAETAPLLKICVSSDTLQMSGTEIDPATILRILNAGSTQVHVKSLLGADTRQNLPYLASAWGGVADCIYRQNSSQVCDIDNRALAVDAINAFMRYAAQVTTDNGGAAAIEIQNIVQIRNRVLDQLKTLLRNGQLIASDFGFLPPSTIRKVLADTTPGRNGCVKN